MTTETQSWTKTWEVGEQIGLGGQGVVRRVKEKAAPHREGVLKTIVDRWKNDQQAEERLRHETETLLKLNDLAARVPLVYDSSLNFEDSEPFLIMQFIEGTRFDKWLEAIAPIEPQKAVILTRSVAETIRLCHAHDIGHRDLKPSNIILQGDDIAKPVVIDFGISFDSRQSVILTGKGEMFWNEFIILPECQDLEGGHRDLRSDITALAGLFFSCITGKPPVVLRDSNELAPHQRYREALNSIAETPVQAERMAWFFDEAFAYRLDKRFQNMERFEEQLSSFVSLEEGEELDLIEQFELLDKVSQDKSRPVQLGFLRERVKPLIDIFFARGNEKIRNVQAAGGKITNHSLNTINLTRKLAGQFPRGDLLISDQFRGISLTRKDFDQSAMVAVFAIAVDMQIEVYTISYSGATGNIGAPLQPFNLSKAAVFDLAKNRDEDQKVDLVVQEMVNKLAYETRRIVSSM